MGRINKPKKRQGVKEYITTLAKAVLLNEGREGQTVQDWIDDEPRRIAAHYEPIKVDALPEASENTMRKIYLVPSTVPGQRDSMEEYITVRTVDGSSYVYSWEKLGVTPLERHILISESEYEALEDAGEIEPDMIYMVYEDEEPPVDDDDEDVPPVEEPVL